MDDPIRHAEIRLWFLLLGRGLVGAFVGMLLFSNPFAPLRSVVNLFLGYLVADGCLSLLAARYAARAARRTKALALVGVIDVLAAIAAFALPAALPLRIIGGIRGVLAGVADVRWSRRLRLSDLLALGGVAAVGCGLLLLGWPGPAINALPWLLGLEAMVSGALFVAGALSQIRGVGEHVEAHV
ncbi:MAG TPA: DUF308 domain-containing protein [Labilithrix sp.]|nr:DUF308 domain-containing protein [Labilithrix sp.]